jgi:hypothetical protein
VYGAYDNGSGSNLMRYLARDLADVQTNRSLVFVWFNGEEEGVLASDLYAKELKAANQKIAAVLGFDMVGISWPVANPISSSCLCMWYGANDRSAFDPLLKYVNFSFLGYPNEQRKVQVVGINTRNSDESSFASAGFPTMRWAGMKTASNYPAYHKPDDTIEKIIEVAGGQSFYEQGIENTHRSAYYTTLTVDNHLPVPVLTATASGMTVAVDGSGSSDPDGQISSYVWDFGDGAMSDEGAVAQHTYTEPGTYTITLEVDDNLWTSVGRTAQVTVTVA